MEPALAETDNGNDQRAYVVDLFPDLDLSATLEAYKHLSPEALVGWIVDNMNGIPRKKKATKRKAADETEVAPLDDYSGFFDASLKVELTLLNKMLWQMSVVMRNDVGDDRKAVGRPEWEARSSFLLNHFQLVKAEFARKVVQHFQGRLVASALACFLSQNRVSPLIQQCATGLNPHFLCTTLKMRRSKMYSSVVGGDAEEEWERYQKLLADFKRRFPSLFIDDPNPSDGHTLHPDAAGLPMVDEEEEEDADEKMDDGVEGCREKIECLVCLDERPFNAMVFCVPPVHRVYGASNNSRINAAETAAAEMPSTSTASTSASVDNSEAAVHAFCRRCLKGQAKAANDEMPLAEGGVGLRCMAYNCRNPLPWTEVCRFIGSDVKRKLDERIAEENLGLASIANLERCKKCNFAVEMEVSVLVNKVFECYACEQKHCRLCEADWDEDHFGVSCSELKKNNAESTKQRALEKKLNDAVVRKCPKCGVAFMKSDGCNKMTCRCGMTMCYLCRTVSITYDHFCPHVRDPSLPNYKCTQCNKSCLLHEDSAKKDEKLIADIIKSEAAAPTQPPGTANLPGSSAPPPANAPPPPANAPPPIRNNPVVAAVNNAVMQAAGTYAQQMGFALNPHVWDQPPQYFNNHAHNFHFQPRNHDHGNHGNHGNHNFGNQPRQHQHQPQAFYQPLPYQQAPVPLHPPLQAAHQIMQQMYRPPQHALPAPFQHFNNNNHANPPVQPAFAPQHQPYPMQAMPAAGGIMRGNHANANIPPHGHP